MLAKASSGEAMAMTITASPARKEARREAPKRCGICRRNFRQPQTPIDHVDVEASFQVLRNDALVGLEVEDVRAIDQRVTEQHGLGMRRRRSAAVAQQLERALFQDDVVRRGADGGVKRRLDDARQVRQPPPEPLLFSDQSCLQLALNAEQAAANVHRASSATSTWPSRR